MIVSTGNIIYEKAKQRSSKKETRSSARFLQVLPAVSRNDRRQNADRRMWIVCYFRKGEMLVRRGSHIPCNDLYARCVGGYAVEATSLRAVAERPERPVRPARLAPVPPGRPVAVAEAASRSEVAGLPSCCSEDEAERRDSVLIPMPGWGSSELIQRQANARSTDVATLITEQRNNAAR